MVVGAVLLTFYLTNENPLNMDVENLSKIEIQNGNNGKFFVLENEEAEDLLEELLKLDVKFVGINGWTSGYEYKVTIISSNDRNEIIIKSNNDFIKGVFKYETEQDLMKLIENIVKE